MTKLVMNNMYMRRKSFNILKKKKKNMEIKTCFIIINTLIIRFNSFKYLLLLKSEMF